MTSVRTLLTALALCASPVLAAPIALGVASTSNLGYATSTNLNPGIYRDGGGGGCVNGLCVIGFSDTTICNGAFQTNGQQELTARCKANNDVLGFNSFAHNTFATFDPAAKSGQPFPPNSLFDFGKHDGTNGQLVGPVLGAVTPDEQAMGGAFAVWPNGNMVPLSAGIGSNEVVGVFNTLKTDGTASGTTLYNTMAKVTVTDFVGDSETMPGERIVPQLFNANENMYGTYSVMAGHNDDFLYLFAKNTSNGVGPTGIKVARVPQASLTDKSTFQYWDGAMWSATQPSVTDLPSNIIGGAGFLDTGEFFWSQRTNSYVHVSASYGTFTIAYSDSLTSGWSAPQPLYTAQIPESISSNSDNNVIYSGHAYPDWDPTGQSLLLSWAVDEFWIQMAVVKFA